MDINIRSELTQNYEEISFVDADSILDFLLEDLEIHLCAPQTEIANLEDLQEWCEQQPRFEGIAPLWTVKEPPAGFTHFSDDLDEMEAIAALYDQSDDYAVALPIYLQEIVRSWDASGFEEAFLGVFETSEDFVLNHLKDNDILEKSGVPFTWFDAAYIYKELHHSYGIHETDHQVIVFVE